MKLSSIGSCSIAKAKERVTRSMQLKEIKHLRKAFSNIKSPKAGTSNLVNGSDYDVLKN